MESLLTCQMGESWERSGAQYCVLWSFSYLVLCPLTEINFLFCAGISFPAGMRSSLVAISEGCYSDFPAYVKKVLVPRMLSERDSYFTLI